MKVVQGQLEMWEFFSKMSSASDSFTSESFREYIKRVAQSQKQFSDVLPRWIQPIPVVNEDGSVSGQFIDPFQDEGRIVQART